MHQKIDMSRFIVALFLISLVGCTADPSSTNSSVDYFAHIEDEKVKSVLRKAIDWSGGIETWRALDSIKYTKHSMLFLEDESVESDVIQRHLYGMQPQFSANIQWSDSSDVFEIRYDGSASKWLNGEQLDQEEGTIKSTVFSALYVLGMPFKLLDGGVNLSYQGATTVKGREADVINATYDPDNHDNHSTSDIWWYYFDVSNGEFLGCLVYHAPTYAYIENQSFVTAGGIKFHAHRKSYRSDSARNIQFLRAEFWYSDYSVVSANP